ncbi:MAG: DUF3237 domain-containing protein [Sciscionella sp.]
MRVSESRGVPAARPPVPGLEHIASVFATLGEPLEVGMTPSGRQRVIPITGGQVTGPRLTGEVLAGGADWQTVLPDGTALIDTRYTVRLADGALVSLATRGVRTGPAEVLQALLAGEDVDPAAYYFRLTVEASTASAEHGWLNRGVFVGAAIRASSSVTYDAYLLT